MLCLVVPVTESIRKPAFQKHFCTLHLLEIPQIQLNLPIVTTYVPRFNTWYTFWQNTEAECWNLHSSADWGDSGFANYRIFGIKEANCVSHIQKFWYLRVGVLQDVIWVMANRTCFPFLPKFHSHCFGGSPQAMNYWTIMLLSICLAYILVPCLFPLYMDVELKHCLLISVVSVLSCNPVYSEKNRSSNTVPDPLLTIEVGVRDFPRSPWVIYIGPVNFTVRGVWCQLLEENLFYRLIYCKSFRSGSGEAF